MKDELSSECRRIADRVVPEYFSGSYSCGGVYAKRWQAAWDAACIALGGNPEDYRK